MDTKPILVTGGTGYVGGRLIPRLLEAGFKVRAMARSPERLLCRPWGRHPAIEVVAGDALDREAFVEAARGCGVAYYLIHSMNAAKGKFAWADRTAAENMVAAAEHNGLARIIYLGGAGGAGPRSLEQTSQIQARGGEYSHGRHRAGNQPARGHDPGFRQRLV